VWLREMHIVIFVPHGNQHFMQWQQKCNELHHGFLCVHCHGCNVKGGYPQGRWDVYTHIGGSLQLKDVVI
jgi:hypothetical protein